MSRTVAAVAACLLFSACADGPGVSASLGEHIVEGEVTTEYETVVAVVPQRIRCNDAPSVMCSGTLVASNAVLSAAHCFDSMRPGLAFEIVVGDSLDGDAESVPVAEVVAHPGFDPQNRSNDIAVLWLARSVRSVVPEPLPAASSATPQAGTGVELVGFGVTSAGAVPDGAKRVGLGRIAEAFADTVVVSPEPSVSCVGDSGGPLFTDSGQLVGVASSGDTGCSETSVYSLIGPAMAAFIEPVLDAGPTERPSALSSCGQVCGSDQACPAGFVCVAAPADSVFRCAWPGQEAGELTGECTTDSGCASGLCAPSHLTGGCQCYDPCDAGKSEASSGGCSIRPANAGAMSVWWLALALLAIKIRHRRRRSLREQRRCVPRRAPRHRAIRFDQRA